MDTPTSPKATQGTAPPTPTPNVPEPQPSPKATVDTAKKYIRTFEGDMEAFKKGQTPNLAPLKVPTITPTQTPAPIPISIPAPAKPPAPIIPNPVKTYSSDFTQRVNETHASTATVLAAEQDAASGVPKDSSEKSTRGNILYIVAGIVLLLLGVTGAYIAYTRYLVKMEPIILAPTVSTPILVNEREKITGTTAKAILQAIEQSLSRPIAPNTVRLLYTDLATTTGDSVFSALQLPAPGVLLRNVNAASSMAGIVNSGGTQSPFFILSVASYGDTFAGMLSWEKTMPQDLSVLFSSYPQVSTTTTATSTQPAPVFIPSFHDEVINNHDVRMYRDSLGRAILVYGYWNQKTLVIARDTAAFIEILNRLATARTQ